MNLDALFGSSTTNGTENEEKEKVDKLQEILDSIQDVKILNIDDLPITEDAKKEFHEKGKTEILLDIDNKIIHSDILESLREVICTHETLSFVKSTPIEGATMAYNLSYICDDCGMEVLIPVTDIKTNLFPRKINMKNGHVCAYSSFDDVDETVSFYREMGYEIVNIMKYTKNMILIEFASEDIKEKLLSALKTFVNH